MRGTLLNTATVAIGGLLGWAVSREVPADYQTVAMSGLGLVTLGIGMKMFFQSRNIIIVAAAVALGGMLGLLLGIHTGIESFSEWAKAQLGGGEHFTQTLVTTSVLFCVGPMTLLGCIQDGLEGKTELLGIKSTMDGIGAFFFAAVSGPAVLVTAAVVLVVQGGLTLGARYLQGFAKDEDFVAESSAAGGVMMLALGLGLLNLKDLHTANYLPALVLAPFFVSIGRYITHRRTAKMGDPHEIDLAPPAS